MDNQHPTFVAALKRYFNDKNLIVIGYSGRDKSLMSALTEAFSERGSGRIYWCGYGSDIPPEVETLLKTAKMQSGKRFILILTVLIKRCFRWL